MSETGVMIGDKHTFKDWGLHMMDFEIPMPEAKTNLVDVPCRDGVIDLTEALDGTVRYNNRKITLTFDITGNVKQWHSLYSVIASYCHGRRMKVIFDEDHDYYYFGRISVSSVKETLIDGVLTISIDADPLKYETVDANQPWLWDTFNFNTGVIRFYNALQVSGIAEYTVIGTNRVVAPEIECTSDMTLTMKDKVFKLKKGITKTSDIRILPGENILKFSGNGTVTIKFRGCSL